MVAASFTTPAIVTVMALVAEISIYFVNTCSQNLKIMKCLISTKSFVPNHITLVTMKKAKDPPISMSKQLRMTCQGLSKYEFF
jgi:hypothetical protein